MPTQASHVWRPSSARVVMLDTFVPVPRGAVAGSPAPVAWPCKDPGDVLDYVLDLSPAFIGNEGDNILDLDVTIIPSAPGDLALNSVTADGASAVLWLSGGQAGTTYAVTVAAVSSSGRSLTRTVQLPVAPLATQAAAVSALSTDTGAPLTDQNGNPVLAP